MPLLLISLFNPMPFCSCHQSPGPLHIPNSDSPEEKFYWYHFSCLSRIFMLSFPIGFQPASGLATDVELSPLSNQLYPWGEKSVLQNRLCPGKAVYMGNPLPSLNHGAHHWLVQPQLHLSKQSQESAIQWQTTVPFVWQPNGQGQGFYSVVKTKPGNWTSHFTHGRAMNFLKKTALDELQLV